MARDRSIKLIIQAQVDGAKRALSETAQAAKKVGDEADKSSKQATTAGQRMVRSARDNQQAWNTVGTTLTAFGAASALALGGATKAAIDWESAWAGVVKTVDGSAVQMSALEEGLRGMARELPASHSEIAAVASAAGQLGIETPNILGFTRTMIDMGESTNLSAEQAATALARFANIMGTSQTEFSNIGSAVVDLGNNFATTEAEIVEMAMRLAGAGRQARLSEGEVLGLATALSSVGIEAQAGGTAFSRVLIEMASAVDSGTSELGTFAQVAGMTAEQFATAWRDDAGSAIAAFVSGLGEMEASGQSIQPVLEELGLTDIRVGDALRRASGAASLFTGAMDMGNEAFAANSALAEEAAQRYATVESRLAMARNSIVDAAISMGEVFLPAIGAVADGTADFAGFLADLPPGVQGLVGTLTGLAGVAGLTGGAFFLMTPRIIESWDAFRDIMNISPRVATNLGRVGRTVARGGVLVGGLVALATAMEAVRQASWEAAPGVEQFTSALLDLEQTGDISSLDKLIEDMNILVRGSGNFDLSSFFSWNGGGEQIDSLTDAVDRLLDPSFVARAENLDKALGLNTSGDRAEEAISRIDSVLAGMSTSMEGAERAARLFDAALGDSGYTTEQLMVLFPQYGEALAALENEARLAGAGAEAAGEGFEGLEADMEKAAIEAEAAQQAFETLKSSIEGLGSALLGVRGSARDYEAALDGIKAAMAEDDWKRTLDITTEAGRENQAMLDGLASSAVNYASAALTAGAGSEEVALIMRRGRQDFIDTAVAMGMQAEEAATLADNLGLVPDNVRMMFEAAGLDDLIQETNGVVDYAGSLEALINLGIRPDVAENMLQDFLYSADTSTGTVSLTADPLLAEGVRLGFVEDVDASVGTVDILADDSPGQATRGTFVGDVDASSGTVDILADDRGAQATRSATLISIDQSSGTVSILGNNGQAISSADNAVWSINQKSATIDVYARVRTTASQVASQARNLLGGIGFPGFETGGYTGDISPKQIAGVTHGQEFVSTATTVADPVNRSALEYMHAGGSMRDWAAPAAAASRWASSYATAPAMQAASPVRAPEIDYDRLAAAMAQVNIPVQVGAETVFKAGRQGAARYGDRPSWGQGPQPGRTR